MSGKQGKLIASRPVASGCVASVLEEKLARRLEQLLRADGQCGISLDVLKNLLLVRAEHVWILK